MLEREETQLGVEELGAPPVDAGNRDRRAEKTIGIPRSPRHVLEPRPFDRQLGALVRRHGGPPNAVVFLEGALEEEQIRRISPQLMRAHLKEARGRSIASHGDAIQVDAEPRPTEPVQ